MLLFCRSTTVSLFLCRAGLSYWRIYREIPEIWRILEAFGYKYFGLAIWRIAGDVVIAFGS